MKLLGKYGEDIAYPVRFLRRKDTGASRLPDFLHLIPEFLLLQGLVRLALTGVVLHRFLQAARTACVHRGRLLISLSFFLSLSRATFIFLFFFCLCFLSGSVSSGRRLQFALAHLLFVCFSLFESDFQTRPPAEFNRERSGHSSSCKPCVHARSRRTHSSDTSKIAPFIFGKKKNIRKEVDSENNPSLEP